VSKPVILVLCTGNSARSQMAEAILRRQVGDHFEVRSAGTEPAPRVHPLAVQVMAEAGYDLASQHPKHLRDFLGKAPVHTVIIVCDGAARSCPAVWPGARERLFWPFPDPAAADGDEYERRETFRAVRDAIAKRVEEWAGAGTEPAAAIATADR
jgi:arsenate reductase (thioredoxin)